MFAIVANLAEGQLVQGGFKYVQAGTQIQLVGGNNNNNNNNDNNINDDNNN